MRWVLESKTNFWRYLHQLATKEAFWCKFFRISLRLRDINLACKASTSYDDNINNYNINIIFYNININKIIMIGYVSKHMRGV